MDKQTRILVALIGALAIICGAIISGMFLLKSVDLKNSGGSSGDTTVSTSSSGNTPSSGGNTIAGTTQPPTTSSGPIAEGDFLYSPGPVTGLQLLSSGMDKAAQMMCVARFNCPLESLLTTKQGIGGNTNQTKICRQIGRSIWHFTTKSLKTRLAPEDKGHQRNQ